MPRDSLKNDHRVALLTTGDEITHGDILNTNSQVIAYKLFSNGIPVGIHLTAPDNLLEIEKAIRYLLKTHQVLIITGGLGPTSDDITRFALSKVLRRSLVFNTTVWDAIVARFISLGYTDPPPEGNRQQALFPKNATMITNAHGTAAGCMVEYNKRIIFMLPGPPSECLPMVDTMVLPTLKQKGFQEVVFHEHWFLFGVSEGLIAEQLDAIAKPFECTTGYRLCYPYIEFKIFSHHKTDFEKVIPLIEEIVKPYVIGNGKQIASELLKEQLKNRQNKLSIQDSATGGLLETSIKTPETAKFLDFSNSTHPNIKISGLKEFWEHENVKESYLEIQFNPGQIIKKNIPFRGSRIKQYAVEYICQEILKYIKLPA